MKGLVNVPPLPANLEEHQQTVTQDMLQRAWEELVYFLTCAVSQAERILNIFYIDYEMHISLNFSFKFGGIIVIMFNIKPV